jgi:hypothetical protein
MPRAPAHARKVFIEDETIVLDWQLEQSLVYGQPMRGSVSELQTRDDWQRAWDRWGDIIMPKALEHRPGARPFAMYAIGTIPARELRMPLPANSGYRYTDVRQRNGKVVRHWIDAPAPFVESEVSHLRYLGIVDDAEYRRYRAWVGRTNPDCDRCVADTYPLEMSLHE